MSISISKLDNGLTVITEAMGHVETAALGVWADVGSRHEAAHEHGISHLLEHMAFKGTSRRTARQIAEEIECVGGELNAATSGENTAYYARVLKEDVGLAVDILGDILEHSTFDPHELEREQQVVVQEIGAAHDTPDDLVFDLFLEAAYPDQPLGRSILGTPETVRAFTSQNLRDYLRGQYRGPGMVLSAAGAVDHAAVCDFAAQHLSAMPAEQNAEPQRAVYGGGEKRVERDLEQAQLAVGVAGPSYFDDDFYAARLLATILGGGMSSRLFQEVREVRGLCYSVTAFHWPYHDTGVFGVYAATGEKELAELTPVIAGELRRAADDISAEELARARQQVKASLLMSLELPSVRAERMARHMMLYGRVIPVEEMLREVNAVQVEHVRALAQKLFSTAQPCIAAIGPLAGLESYDKIAQRLN
mgnify:CR=1 FL=1